MASMVLPRTIRASLLSSTIRMVIAISLAPTRGRPAAPTLCLQIVRFNGHRAAKLRHHEVAHERLVRLARNPDAMAQQGLHDRGVGLPTLAKIDRGRFDA